MTTELPIACSLSAPDLARRLADIAEIGRDALIDSRVSARTAVLRFAAGAGIRERVAAIAEAEAECCAFLTLRVTEEQDAIVLTIAGPEGAEVVVRELAGAFAATQASCGTTTSAASAGVTPG